MADDFEVHKMKNGNVIVVLHPTCALTKKAILVLLAELGIDESAVIFLLPTEVSEHSGSIGDLPVVIPVDEASCDLPELEATARQCAQAGGRVIVLFGDDFAYEGLHPIADKYGSQCAWVPSDLQECFKAPVSAAPRASSGKPVARPEANQVKCGH